MSRRYRLQPTPSQEKALELHCRHAQFVWNIALEQRRAWRPGRANIGVAQQMRELAEARREFPWLGHGSSSVQQQALRDLDRAFQGFFEDVKAAKRQKRPRLVGYPAWKRAKRSEARFCVRDLRVQVRSDAWAALHVPKCGWVRFRLSRPLPEGGGMARVTLDCAGRWHVAITSVPEPFAREATGALVGLDRGVVNSIATSDGAVDHAPGLRPKEAERSRRLQQRLARQREGSNRRQRSKRCLGRLRAREVDRRKDWVERTTTTLVRNYDVIIIEKLRVKDMARSATGTIAEPGHNVRAKAALNRAILGQGWGATAQRLKDKAAASGTAVVVEVNPRYTSRTCRVCGHEAKGNRESQAVFHCLACGHVQHADTHAAENIRERGVAVLAKPAPAAGPVVAARGHLCRARGRSANDPRRMANAVA